MTGPSPGASVTLVVLGQLCTTGNINLNQVNGKGPYQSQRFKNIVTKNIVHCLVLVNALMGLIELYCKLLPHTAI